MTDNEKAKRESVLEKLIKLMNMADGAAKVGNQAEAEAFAAKAQEIMLKYEIELSETEFLRRNEAEPIDGEWLYPKTMGIKLRGSPMEWQVAIAIAVSEAYGCTALFSSRNNAVKFIGRKQARELTIYVYTVLVRTAERLMKKARRDQKKAMGWTQDGFQGSYLKGFAQAIQDRLRKDRQEMEKTMRGTGVSLVRVDTEKSAVKKWVDENITFGKPIGRFGEKSRFNQQAHGAGFADGMKTPIHKAAKGGTTPSQVTGVQKLIGGN